MLAADDGMKRLKWTIPYLLYSSSALVYELQVVFSYHHRHMACPKVAVLVQTRTGGNSL